MLISPVPGRSAFFERFFGISGSYKNQSEEPEIKYIEKIDDYFPKELLAAEDGKVDYSQT